MNNRPVKSRKPFSHSTIPWEFKNFEIKDMTTNDTKHMVSRFDDIVSNPNPAKIASARIAIYGSISLN